MAVDTTELVRQVDLPALVGLVPRGRNWLACPCPFCGGRDRFVLRHTAERGWVWYCRGCGDGRYHDAVDFIMRRDGVGFAQALAHLARLAGQDIPAARPERPAAVAEQRQASVAAPDRAWQEAAWAALRRAQAALTPDSPVGRYLLSRGIRQETWAAWGLGAGVYAHKGRSTPAVVLPTFDGGSSKLWAIKYRLLQPAPEGRRYVLLRGSVPMVFGLQRCRPSLERGLLVVEGELNALSAWQERPEPWDVVSMGSGTAGAPILKVLAALGRAYGKRAAWLDEEEKALTLGRKLGAGVILHSPVIAGEKYDANHILQAGKLRETLAAVLGLPRQDAADRDKSTAKKILRPLRAVLAYPDTPGRCGVCGWPGAHRSPDGTTFCDVHAWAAAYDWSGMFEEDVCAVCGGWPVVVYRPDGNGYCERHKEKANDKATPPPPPSQVVRGGGECICCHNPILVDGYSPLCPVCYAEAGFCAPGPDRLARDVALQRERLKAAGGA